MDGLVEGRIVHFVLEEGIQAENNIKVSKACTCRPAIIVNAWNGSLEDGMINIQVFLDGRNDEKFFPRNTMQDFFQISNPLQVWATSVKYSELKETRTWHWPERQ